MKLGLFEINSEKHIGLVPKAAPGKVLPLSDLLDGRTDLTSIIERPDVISKIRALDSGSASTNDAVDLAIVKFLPPIERPGKIICLAGNYRAHIAESGYVEPQKQANFTQQLFLKPSTSLIGNTATIELNGTNAKVGWENELAVVIGRGGRNISAADAYAHVFGYTILNDLSERGLNSRIEDRHLREMDGFLDWLAGKWFDGFAPCGPWIVTLDEIEDPHDLEIKFYLNGDLRQHGNTKDMIFKIPEQVAYASSIMTLEPGDIISTGTPSGAGLGDKATSLSDGDVMVCEIESLGALQNSVRWKT